MEANPDVQNILGKLYLFDLGCSCKELLLSNYKAHDNQSAWPISAIKAIYVLRFCWGLSTTICFNPSTPTFCSLDSQLFREIPLSEHQSNSPLSRFPSTLQSFVLSSRIYLFQRYIRRALEKLTRTNILDSTARCFSSSHFIVKLDVIVKSMDINIRAKGPFLNVETKVTISYFSLSSKSSCFFFSDSPASIMHCIFTLGIK